MDKLILPHRPKKSTSDSPQMSSKMTTQKPFRFLDLPPELRLLVYEQIDFPLQHHSLSRQQSRISEPSWPTPPTAQGYDSSITLVKPQLSAEILLTCRLINKEASSIFARKAIDSRHQPIRYIVDLNAAYVLTSCGCFEYLLSCEKDYFSDDLAPEPVKRFLSHCRPMLSFCRQNQEVREIEMTIVYKSDAIYPMALELLSNLSWFKDNFPNTRLAIVYKGPLPGLMMLENVPGWPSTDTAETLLQNMPQDDGTNDRPGAFLRPLEEEAFEKHLKALEWAPDAAEKLGSTI